MKKVTAILALMVLSISLGCTKEEPVRKKDMPAESPGGVTGTPAEAP